MVTEYDHSCGYGFTDDNRHVVVFAARDGLGRLTTHACSGTVPSLRDDPWYLETDSGRYERYDPGAHTLAYLGPGRLPRAEPGADPWPSLAGWGGFLLVVMLAYHVGRRRPRDATHA